jgi:hypothetical protein
MKYQPLEEAKRDILEIGRRMYDKGASPPTAFTLSTTS